MIELGPIWHPSPGVNQMNVSLGRRVNMSLDEVIRRFRAVPGVTGAGAAGGMWLRGQIDLKLESAAWTNKLRADLVRVCQAILRDD